MHLPGFFYPVRNILLAGSHIIMAFSLAYLAISAFYLDIIAFGIILLAGAIFYCYYRFYLKPKEYKKNLFFSYLSLLLMLLFLGYLAGIRQPVEIFTAISGIFMMFIRVLSTFFLMVGLPFIAWVFVLFGVIWLTIKYPKYIFLICLAFTILSMTFFYYFTANPEKIGPEKIRPIIFFMEKLIYLFYGGIVILHIDYLISGNDYSLKPKLR